MATDVSASKVGSIMRRAHGSYRRSLYLDESQMLNVTGTITPLCAFFQQFVFDLRSKLARLRFVVYNENSNALENAIESWTNTTEFSTVFITGREYLICGKNMSR